MENVELKQGLLAAEVLRLVCKDPENACAYGIAHAMNQARPKEEQMIYDAAVGKILKLLTADGALEPLPPRAPGRKILYRPTWKAGMYLALSNQSL